MPAPLPARPPAPGFPFLSPASLHAKVHIINFARSMTMTSALMLIPLRFVRLGFNGWQIGLLISLYAAAPLVVAFPTGWINDRFSISGVLRATILADAALFVALAYARTFALTAPVFLGLGLANNILNVSVSSLYYKDETVMDENRKFGRFTFWLGVGPAVGLLAGGFLTQYGSFKTLFLAFAAVMAVAFFVVGRFDGHRFHVVSFREYGRDLFQPRTLLFVAFMFLLALHWGVEGTVYSPFVHQVLGLDNLRTAVYIAFGMLALAFSALSVSRIEFHPDSNRRLLVLAMALSGAGLILMVQKSAYLSFAFRLVHEAGDGMLGALITVRISRLFERRTIGGSAGLLFSFQILGQMTGSMIFSPMGYKLGLHWPMWVAGGMLLANAFYGAMVMRKTGY